MDKRCVDIDDVLDLFGIDDRDIYAKGTIEDALYDGTLKVYNLPSAQTEGWMERNKERILQAGMAGREIEFRIGGRLFAIREKAQ